MKKLHNRNAKIHDGLKTFHFFVFASSLLIVVFSSLFLLNIENYRIKRAFYSYVDLREQYNMVEDEVVYELLNQVFLGKGVVLPDSMKWNINCFTIPHSQTLKSFITNVSDELLSQTDKISMKRQLNTTIFLWNDEKLNNARCLCPKDYYEVGQNDSIDYWVKYRASFGHGGDHHFSKPIFNSDRSLAVIEYENYFDWLAASNNIILYKKENGKWILVKWQNIWVS